MKILGIDLTYTVNYWSRLLGLKKPPTKSVAKKKAPKQKDTTKQLETANASVTPVEKNIFKIFDPGELITDEEFTDSASMTAEEIEAFLVRKKGVILAGTMIHGHLVSYWLSKHCQDLGLNPRILLTHLQKEMGAVTRKAKYKKQHSYDYIMGVGAYDGKWSDKWKGMDKQILGAAKTCMKWYNRGQKSNTYPMNLKAGDRKDLMIKNSATYSLYKYTPWVGDKDKKIPTNKGFHVYKKPFGCYLFWKVYKGFFKRR